MISAYERGLRQPTLLTLLRLLNAAGLDLHMQLVNLDPHDGVLDRLEQDRSPEDRERMGEFDIAFHPAAFQTGHDSLERAAENNHPNKTRLWWPIDSR